MRRPYLPLPPRCNALPQKAKQATPETTEDTHSPRGIVLPLLFRVDLLLAHERLPGRQSIDPVPELRLIRAKVLQREGDTQREAACRKPAT